MNYKKASDAFFNSFHSNHVILYIGQNTKDDDLREYLAKCPWSCIVTSRRDPELSSFFVNEDRTPKDFSDRTKIPAKILNRKKLPVFRLFGVQGEQIEDDLDWLRTDDTDSTYDINRAQNMLSLLPELLDHVNILVVVGATSEIDWKLFGSGLNMLLYKQVSDGTVSFWDVPASVDEQFARTHAALLQVAQRKNYAVYEDSIVEIIRTRLNEFEDDAVYEQISPNSEDDIYYQARKPVSISQRDLLVFKNVGTLLTERTITKIRPLGRTMSRKWFSNFLEASSALGPQWYGYLPQSEFHVKRSFEDALYYSVQKMLEGRSLTGASIENRPIILTGDPGSSKSVTLAALAYRIYRETVNPVIFIPKDSFLSNNIGVGFDELDEAMQLLEQKAETDTRILVIWDSSAYKTGIARAQRLLSQLWNRGRRFVLVCSSYNVNTKDSDDDTGYRIDSSGKQFELCEASKAQVLDKDGCYYVKAIREMNDTEIIDFWKKVKEFSGINDTTISRFKKKMVLENRREIFEYFFLLISLLRENLTASLKSERSKVTPYVAQEIQKAIRGIHNSTKKDKKSSPMFQAFLNAGYDPSDFFKEEEIEQENVHSAVDKKLDDLNLCVALFSRFNLSVPYSLAYTILVGEDIAEQYSESTRALYQVVTNDIPWLHYGEDGNGNFSFRFRNTLEAEIFLSTHEFNSDQQIDLICEIIDIYGKDYRRSGCKDAAFTENLQALLRFIGPNSEHFNGETPEHMRVLQQLDILIDKLSDLRDVYGVIDDDAGFASIIVTFIREYYGSMWGKIYSSAEHFSPEEYEYRIERLLSAITLTENCVDAIENKLTAKLSNYSERQHLLNQRYSLAVEIAQCSMRLEDLTGEYISCCQDNGVKIKKELTTRKLSYHELYRQLMPVISSNPTNGYAYNSLFRAFERAYEKKDMSEAKKLQYLSEIMQVVESCETLGAEITSRGSHGTDELTQHINCIKDFCSGMRITLDSIQRHRRGIAPEDEAEQVCFEMYDEMLEANNAAAITFVCQKELRIPKGTKRLNDYQYMQCRKVYLFMKEEDNFECVRTNSYALAMLIRVAWMVHNRTVLSSSPECQLTYLSADAWLEIYRLCREYEAIAGSNKQPLIILLYALSALHISGLTEQGYMEAVEILGSMDEDMFHQRRMWTPFMVCREDGTPYQFTGTVISVKDNNGFIRVNGVPPRLKKEVGVRFRQYNLGRRRKMPERNDVLSGLELGLGYTCLSVYTEMGRKEREAKV